MRLVPEYCRYSNFPHSSWLPPTWSPTLRDVTSSRTIDVFGFRDYRAFLRAYYAHHRLSLRGFSMRAGIRSPNYLKLVMDGQRNLSPEMASRFANACRLRGRSAEYFCELVSFNQAKTSDEQERSYARLQRFPRYRQVHVLDSAQDAYHSHWYIPAIRELAARTDFRENPQWIAGTLVPRISSGEASKALRTLEQLGLLVRDDEGCLRQAASLVSTPEGPLGYHIVKYHRTMLARAAESMDVVPRDEREISALTLCVSERRMQELKAELERFREEMLHRYGVDEDGERVVHVGLQLVPLSKKEGER